MKLQFRLFLILVLAFISSNSQTLPPNIDADGEQLFCGDSPMPIVTNVSIQNSNGTQGQLDRIYIQIVNGYTIGDDQLILTELHPNITASWSIGEGKLTLNGPASFNDFENAILDVVFSTSQANFTADKIFSINLGEANFLPATGHYYEYVPDLGITWTEAKSAAEAMTFFGLQGYLATITTPEEAQLTGAQSPGTGWIGGSDQGVEGRWVWETGPEEGQVFWNGLADGSAPNGAFAFWNSGEPNSFGDEDYAHITDPNIGLLGSWNDLPNEGEQDPNSPYHPQGYVVEFGGLEGEPQLNISASTKIITPKIEFTTENICDEGNVQFVITESNVDTILWYDAEFSDSPIATGLNYQQFISASTTLWVLPLFNGCQGGKKIPLTSLVYTSPQGNDISVIQCEDAVIDGFSSFNLNNYFDNIVAGNFIQPISNLELTFYEDALLSNEIDANDYTNISNPQIVYVEIYNTSTTCSDVSEVVLNVVEGETRLAELEVCDDFVVDGFTFFNLTDANSQLLQDNTNLTVDYYETYQEALLEINPLPTSYFNTVPYQHTIYGRLSANNDCFAISPVILKVSNGPEVEPYQEFFYCSNLFPEPLTLTGGIVNDIPNDYYYNWSTGETTIEIEVNEPGLYTVEVTDVKGCSSLRTIRVFTSGLPTLTVDITDGIENNQVVVNANGDGDYEYAMNLENGPYQDDNTFENVTAGIQTVFVRDKNGCGIASLSFPVIGFPKFFTPNGDAQNDYWTIKGFDDEFLANSKVQIFNRYGKLLTVLTAQNRFWDGRYNGNPMPSDDYWFSVQLQDGRLFTRHFSLKR